MHTYYEKTRMPRTMLVILVFQFLLLMLLYIRDRENQSFMIIALIIGLLVFFLWFSSLSLKIDSEAIAYRFTPFISNRIPWHNIKYTEVIKLEALQDFAGWGIRHSKKYGWAYITDAEYGLFIERKDGKKMTIAIKDKDALEKCLKENMLLDVYSS
ncbi:hypothetical protein KO02_09505 [Sphingobacterium sp. ML3W]|uniref:hypothetical protein n=1 Tax=Sphingobacterium sp. ML3W TaxID=1538644 RepID=UPI0004F8A243|nr:hypothetical protein [Sphingobacterium sp. ML3W]AIM36900.1 hypothetical protein KO02_09505 [Sphingobacterium sp. ML3W]